MHTAFPRSQSSGVSEHWKMIQICHSIGSDSIKLWISDARVGQNFRKSYTPLIYTIKPHCFLQSATNHARSHSNNILIKEFQINNVFYKKCQNFYEINLKILCYTCHLVISGNTNILPSNNLLGAFIRRFIRCSNCNYLTFSLTSSLPGLNSYPIAQHLKP